METLAHSCIAKWKNKYFLSNYTTVITSTFSEKRKQSAKMNFVKGEEILRRFKKKKSDITQYGLLQFAIIYFGTVTIDQNIRTINRNASSIKYARRKKQYNLACSKPFIWHTAVFATPIALLEYFL